MLTTTIPRYAGVASQPDMPFAVFRYAADKITAQSVIRGITALIVFCRGDRMAKPSVYPIYKFPSEDASNERTERYSMFIFCSYPFSTEIPPEAIQLLCKLPYYWSPAISFHLLSEQSHE